jgi:dihydroorotate dehydrogenase (fumarate)
MDLTTTYLGLNLRSPIVPSAAAPLTENIDNVKRMEDAGAGAVILHSLFEEQIIRERYELEYHLSSHTESFAEALTYFPQPEIFHVGTNEYLNHIRTAKAAVNIPIIASLNGFSLGGWTHYAKEIEQAGADALELNIYSVPSNPDISGAEIEENYFNIVRAVRADISIPLAVKISPYFSNLAYMARKLDECGANGLVLFNRFMGPDISLEELEVKPEATLSTPEAMRLPLRWIAILYGRIEADLASTGGVNKGKDALKMLMAGAKITQVCSTLLRHGIGHIQELETEIKHWMEEHEYHSIKQMQGCLSQINCPDESAYERAQYMRGIQSYTPDHSLV